MKPIKLSISGLHSFRELQEIRFDELSTSGVFGIFGPTGSGKSTILDALTLSLYGTVGRAEHNTRGILNHAEKALAVSLVFEVGTPTLRQTYRVERSYKRKDDVAVQNVRSRLVEVQGEQEIVLADKDSDVTAGVKDILGLEPEDFTRAVVLPQGRFAEFLNLRGADRNKMLERLFSLEQYGDALNQRLRGKFDAVEREHGRIVAMQQGIGEASLEAVVQAESDLAAAQGAAQHARNAVDEAGKQYDQAKGIWNKQADLQRVEAALLQHRLRADEVRGIVAAIDRATRATRVTPFIRAAEEAEIQGRARTQEWDAWQVKLPTLQNRVEALAEQLERASFEHEKRRPDLLKRELKLEEAEALESSLILLNKDLEAMEEAHKGAVTGCQQAALKNTARATDVATLQARVAKLQEALQRVTVTADRRTRLQALQAKSHAFVTAYDGYQQVLHTSAERQQARLRAQQTFEAAEVSLTATRAHLEALQTGPMTDARGPDVDLTVLHQRERSLDHLQNLAKQWEDAEHQQAGEIQRSANLQQQLEQAHAALDGTTSEHEQALLHLAACKSTREALVQHSRLHAAAEMAAELQPGNACLVCGSTIHPKRASFAEVTDGAAMERVEGQLTAAQARVDAGSAQMAQHREALATLDATQESLRTTVTQVKARIASLQGEVRSIDANAPLETCSLLLTWIAHEQSRVAAHRLDFQSREQTRQDTARQVQELLQLAADEQAAVAAAGAHEKAAEAEWLRAEETLKQSAAVVTVTEREFVALLADVQVHPADRREEGVQWVESALSELAQKDKQFEQLQRENRDIQAELELAIEQRDRAQEQLGELRIQRNQTQAALEAVTEVRTAKAQQLLQLTGGVSVATALQAVAAELAELQAHVAEALHQHQTSSDLLQQAVTTLAIAKTRMESAVDALKKCQGELHTKVAEEHFVTVGDVLDAQLDLEEMQSKQNDVHVYSEAESRFVAERDALLKGLGDVRISPEDWMAIHKSLEAAQVAGRSASEAVGGADNVLRELRARHTLWMEWEAERLICAQELTRLATLKQLMAGNKFVEFMAQEQMEFVALHASERLKQLTRNRYALEIAADGRFIMRDDHNGGVKRPVATLSGGETFLTSLALALSLSTQIQLRGKYPLQFFFLDEGFGTLDAELLDVVMSSLEKLHMEQMTIGVISHVPELRQRMQRRLIVEPPEAAGRGTRVHMEMA